MSVPVNWVVALLPEAKPLIQHLGLKHSQSISGGGFSVYENEANRLILSGIGKINSAAATAWLAGRIDSSPNEIWINFGIAGSIDREIGTVIRGARITDEATKRSWYPPRLISSKKSKFDDFEILTVDHPSDDYPEGNIALEMEAAGFVSTALRFSTLEMIQAIKVISDNQKTDFRQLNPAKVEQIISEISPDLIEWVEKLRDTVGDFSSASAPEGLDEVVERFRFSETEKHQFRRLVQRSLALGKYSGVEEWILTQDLKSGKEIIRAHRELLADTEAGEN